jgi:hypothetical protein
MSVNWEAQRRMKKDVREHPELYAALAGNSDDDNDDSTE